MGLSSRDRCWRFVRTETWEVVEGSEVDEVDSVAEVDSKETLAVEVVSPADSKVRPPASS